MSYFFSQKREIVEEIVGSGKSSVLYYINLKEEEAQCF